MAPRVESETIWGDYCPVPLSAYYSPYPYHCDILARMLHSPAVTSGVASLALAASLSGCSGGQGAGARHSWESVYMVAAQNDNEAGLVCLDDDSPTPCH